uniref:Transmembrane protein n=2 Tax=Compsopogon caeruleus TaxID=31354 RepID=A0A7S1TF90_9RHOD|mmetsp:Transcript_17876/g.37120  ORF Transcript_17876/g.37120 Transcript_17876/m.37120 type:complete len:599 (+) Transcript_17876:214-2010(+)
MNESHGSRVNPNAAIEIALGNLITLAVLGLLYCNFLLFREYMSMLVGAVVVALAFGGMKSTVVGYLEGSMRSRDLRREASGELSILVADSKAEVAFLLCAFGVTCVGSTTVAGMTLVVVAGISVVLLVSLLIGRMLVRLRVFDAHSLATLFVILAALGTLIALILVSMIGVFLEAAGSATSAVASAREALSQRGFQATEMLNRINVDELVERGVYQVEKRLDDVVYESLENTLPPQVAAVMLSKCEYAAVSKSMTCMSLRTVKEQYVQHLRTQGSSEDEIAEALQTVSIANVSIRIPSSPEEATEVARQLLLAFGPTDLLERVDLKWPNTYEEVISLGRQIYREVGPRELWRQTQSAFYFLRGSSFKSFGKAIGRFFESSAGVGTKLLSFSFALLSFLFHALASSADFFESVIVFVGVLFVLLRREQDLVNTIANRIPLPDESLRVMVEKDLKSAVRSLFWSRCRSFFRNAAFVFLTFSGLKLNFSVLASWVAGVTAVVTVLPDPWISTLIIGGPQLAFQGAWVRGGLLVGSHFLFNQLIDDEEPDGFEGVSSVVALSAVIGTSVFGSQGAGYGPLLVYLLIILNKLYSRLHSSSMEK